MGTPSTRSHWCIRRRSRRHRAPGPSWSCSRRPAPRPARTDPGTIVVARCAAAPLPKEREGRCETYCESRASARRRLLGVGLDEPLDELVDRAGLRQVALGGLLGQLGLGEALVALASLGLGLLASLTRRLGGVAGLLTLGLLGLVGLLANRLLDLVGTVAGELGDAADLVADDAADRLELLAGDAGQRVRDLGQLTGVLVVEVHDLLDEGELALDGLGDVDLREVADGRVGAELVGDGVEAVLPAVERGREGGLGGAGSCGVANCGGHEVLQR